MKSCQDCGAPIEFKKEAGRWIPMDPFQPHDYDEVPREPVEHWRTCTSSRARDRRVRHFLEPGVFPASISALISYKRCPAWYRRVKLGGEVDSKGPYARFGIEFHRFAEAWLTDAPIPELHPPIEAWDEFTRAVESFKRLAWDTSKLVAVEERLTHGWQEGAMQVEFMAVVDALMIDGDLAIIPDWKTGHQLSDEEQLEKDLQALGNCLVVSKHYPQLNAFLPQQVQTRLGCRIVMPRDADGRPKPYSRDDLVRFESVLKAEIRQMMTDTEYVANPDCNYCPPGAHARSKSLDVYRSMNLDFARGKMAIEIAEPRTIDEARRVAAGTKFAGALYGAGKKALEPFASREGAVDLGDWGAFGFWASEEIKCADMQWLADWLLSHGMKLDDYLRADTRKLRTLVENYPELKAIINARIESEFGWRKDVEGAKKKNAQLESEIMRGFYTETQTAELTVIEGGKG
jgi:hypothetical protein